MQNAMHQLQLFWIQMIDERKHHFHTIFVCWLIRKRKKNEITFLKTWETFWQFFQIHIEHFFVSKFLMK